ncbi:tail fiber assembly protein [Escherichia coli]|nr:tail fiber assembly protein [Escherichia coli]EFI9521189.1 tail fiber assembly protein [Escherichia coli]
MRIFYSAEHNGFFTDAIAYNPKPTDLIEVSHDVRDEFIAGRVGKIMQPGVDGLPEWVDAPPPSRDEQIATAERKRAELRITADSEIAWRQDAVDAGIETDDEANELAAWKKYRVLLMRIDTSKRPDIEWPVIPV